MLRTRIITAVALLALLLPVLYFNFFPGFALLTVVFFAAAVWENSRLFGTDRAVPSVLLWSAMFALLVFKGDLDNAWLLFLLCVGFWLARLIPKLASGLPDMQGLANRFLWAQYAVAIFGCFVAIVVLFRHSPLYLLSVLALVWLADIGAYFCGRAFGRRKLALSISPGKSWEGAIGGGLIVLLACLALLAGGVPALQDTFEVRLYRAWGVLPFVVVIVLIVCASVIGDLFESLLKRRAGVKDSSKLLPGHGGVLDRIDALIPVLPLAALVDRFL
jgi:phosphatidate cytidylyltransferase